jgi:hypothetical protein
MPLEVDKLTEQSDVPAIKMAIGSSIQQCMQEGKDQKQCAAIAYEVARRKTGKEIA